MATLSRVLSASRRLTIIVAFLALVSGFWIVLPAQAAVFNPGCSTSSLLTAVAMAGGNAQSDTINLAAGCTYNLTAPLSFNADAGNLVTVNGNGAILNGGDTMRVMTLNSSANVTVNSVTIRDGFAPEGGGIYVNQGTLNLNSSIVTSSSASAGGGGLYNNFGTVTVMNSTFSGNVATGVSGGSGVGGGIVSSAATLTINNSTFENNTAVFGGGLYLVFGTVTVTGSTFLTNSATSNAGGIYADATLTLQNSTLSGNSTPGNGGALYNSTSVALFNTTISGNSAGSGGGIYTVGSADLYNSIIANSTSGGDCVRDGGIIDSGGSLIEDSLSCLNGSNTVANLTGDPALGTLTGSPAYFPLTLTSIALNRGDSGLVPVGLTTDQRGAGFARLQGTRPDMGSFEAQCMNFPYTVPGANTGQLILAADCASATPANDVIDLTNSTYTMPGRAIDISGTVTINGHNATLNGNAASGIFDLNASADVSINAMTLTNSSAVSNGFGGGIHVDGGTLNVTGVTFTDNANPSIYSSGGGGIDNLEGIVTVNSSTFTGNTGRQAGGAIRNEGGVMTVTNSTFTGNSAPINGGAIQSSNGTLTVIGSTFIDNESDLGGAILITSGNGTVINSTFTGNDALDDERGGAIYSGGALTMTNSTLSGNNNGIYASGTTTLNNNIFANSTPGADCTRSGGTINARNNLIESSLTCVNGTNVNNLTGSDPQLGTLTGSPAYFPILPTSPARNAGNNGLIPMGITTDQPGNPRIASGMVDMGAYELPDASLVVTLTLQGRPGGASATKVIAVHVQIRPPGSTTPITSADYISDTNGRITVPVAPGTVDVRIKGTHTLAVLHNVTLSAGVNNLTTALLREGDADDSNTIILTDFSLLAAAFGTVTGNPNFNPQADFNGDGQIQLIDFSLLASNFNQAGAP